MSNYDCFLDFDNLVAAFHRATRITAGRNALGVKAHDAAVAAERPGFRVHQTYRVYLDKCHGSEE